MKKHLFFLIFIITVSVSEAQIRGEVRLQAGGVYQFRSEVFGVNFGAEYFIANRFSLAPNYTILLPRNYSASYKSKNHVLNVDARYYFSQDAVQFYGIAGYSNHMFRSTYHSFKYRSNYAGANLGIGTILKLTDRIAINPEVKYHIFFEGGRIPVARLGLVYLIN